MEDLNQDTYWEESEPSQNQNSSSEDQKADVDSETGDRTQIVDSNADLDDQSAEEEDEEENDSLILEDDNAAAHSSPDDMGDDRDGEENSQTLSETIRALPPPTQIDEDKRTTYPPMNTTMSFWPAEDDQTDVVEVKSHRPTVRWNPTSTTPASMATVYVGHFSREDKDIVWGQLVPHPQGWRLKFLRGPGFDSVKNLVKAKDVLFVPNSPIIEAYWFSHLLENFNNLDEDQRHRLHVTSRMTYNTHKEKVDLLRCTVRLILEQSVGEQAKDNKGFSLRQINQKDQAKIPAWIMYFLSSDGEEITPLYYMPLGKQTAPNSFVVSAEPPEVLEDISEADLESLRDSEDMVAVASWISNRRDIQRRPNHDAVYQIILDLTENWWSSRLSLELLKRAIYLQTNNILRHKTLKSEVKRLQDLNEWNAAQAKGLKPDVRKPRKRKADDEEMAQEGGMSGQASSSPLALKSLPMFEESDWKEWDISITAEVLEILFCY
ncbi:hypothetical protein H2200_012989 [Cladophialophora chaetospira]|uniref:Uncharacterized protein n=1 Tax=Cladophialophora chaetospira TaxID=386627 RepID=A0AA38WWL6_9EURO|nr:hypothetical protein H2200_012989 [Cladophialophora chaetospira]